jgi:hypothetical protein
MRSQRLGAPCSRSTLAVTATRKDRCPHAGLAGADDPLAVRPEALADAVPDATLQIVDGNHIGALGDPRFTRSIVDFLPEAAARRQVQKLGCRGWTRSTSSSPTI